MFMSGTTRLASVLLAIGVFQVSCTAILLVAVHHVLHFYLYSVIIYRNLLLRVERPNSVLVILIRLIEQLSTLQHVLSYKSLLSRSR